LSYVADKQTNKQTKTGKNITSLAEVTRQEYFLLLISVKYPHLVYTNNVKRNQTPIDARANCSRSRPRPRL